MLIPHLLLSEKRNTRRQGKRNSKRLYILYQDLLSLIYDTTLEIFEFKAIVLNSLEETATRSSFLVRMSMGSPAMRR